MLREKENVEEKSTDNCCENIFSEMGGGGLEDSHRAQEYFFLFVCLNREHSLC